MTKPEERSFSLLAAVGPATATSPSKTSMVHRRARRVSDPGLEAAGLLLRIGMVILCLIVPVVAFLSRRAVVVLVPIGLTTIILASAIKAEDFRVLRLVKTVLSRATGAAAALLAFWMVTSLLWTPFPVDAAEKLFKAVGTAVLVFAACLALPERMRAPNLHLITIGTLLATLAGLSIAAIRQFDASLIVVDPVTQARAAVMLSILIFAAVAWLRTRAQPLMALLLAVFAGVAIILSRSHIAQVLFAAGCLTFLVSSVAARSVALLSGSIAALTILAAPALALVAHYGALKPLAALEGAAIRILPLAEWGTLILSEPLRLLTGHGFDTAARARASGLIPSGMLRNVIFELWFELGLVGAFAAASLLYAAYRGALGLPRPLEACMTAALTSAFIFAVIGDGIVQIWWLSSLSVIAIGFVAVFNGQHRMVRPKALQQSGELEGRTRSARAIGSAGRWA